MKRTIAGAAAGILAALVVGYANFGYAHTTQTQFSTFKSSICTLVGQQGRQSRGFYTLLHVLEGRALQRERIDRRRGEPTLAAADADSARLYESVLAGYNVGSGARPALDCPAR